MIRITQRALLQDFMIARFCLSVTFMSLFQAHSLARTDVRKGAVKWALPVSCFANGTNLGDSINPAQADSLIQPPLEISPLIQYLAEKQVF